MTTQKTFKRRVRDRMAKTGESYTAARRMLIESGVRPDPGTPTFEPLMADDKMVAKTGRDHATWFALIDAERAGRPHHHTEIVEWLMHTHSIDGWWAQSLTVSYERARGIRAKGQRANGWAVTATKTVAVPVDRLFDAFEVVEQRGQWLPDADLTTRTATRPLRARYDWEDGTTRVVVLFEAKGAAKSTVSLEHERLPDADTAEAMKAYWRTAMVELKTWLEAGGP